MGLTGNKGEFSGFKITLGSLFVQPAVGSDKLTEKSHIGVNVRMGIAEIILPLLRKKRQIPGTGIQPAESPQRIKWMMFLRIVQDLDEVFSQIPGFVEKGFGCDAVPHVNDTNIIGQTGMRSIPPQGHARLEKRIPHLGKRTVAQGDFLHCRTESCGGSVKVFIGFSKKGQCFCRILFALCR